MGASSYTTDPIRIVDVDSHLTEPAGLWVDHAPARYKDRVPTIVADDQGRPHWVADGNDLGAIAFTAIAPDGSRIEGETLGMFQHFEDMHPGAYDFKARLDWLDAHGIHQQVMFPNIPGFGADRFFTKIPDSELRTACVAIYNDAVAEIQRESGGRLLPLALVPWWDSEQAMKEVRRARSELDLKGITMCEAPHAFGYPSLDRPEWEPFWSECEASGLPVCFHIGSGVTGTFAASVWSQEGSGERLATATTNSFLGNAFLVSNLVFSGVLLKHPRLKIFSAETGIGWVPFLLEAMDYQWRENLTSEVRRDVWKGTIPSELFRRSIFVSFWFERFGPANGIDMIGVDNVMFETDFPHGTALTDRMTDHVAATLSAFSPDVRRKVLRDNAARVFNLD
jgi:predicted TIM-barrel fold metal-dependent hydrolase